MAKIELHLSDEDHIALRRVSDLLNRDEMETARLILTTGVAYANQRIDSNPSGDVVTIMLHSLLSAPVVPEMLKPN